MQPLLDRDDGKTEEPGDIMSATRRRFLDRMDEGVMTLSAWQLAACGEEPADAGKAAAITAIWNGLAAELEARGLASSCEPGSCDEQGADHVPAATVHDLEVTVWVARENTQEHFTDHIYIKDQDGLVVGMANLLADDDSSKVTFPVPAGTRSVTPYSSCTQHGLWVGKTILLT